VKQSLIRRKGKRLWAAFGDEHRCRVKDIGVRSWLGQEYWRLRGGRVEVSRAQGYRILHDALRNQHGGWIKPTASKSGCGASCDASHLIASPFQNSEFVSTRLASHRGQKKAGIWSWARFVLSGERACSLRQINVGIVSCLAPSSSGFFGSTSVTVF